MRVGLFAQHDDAGGSAPRGGGFFFVWVGCVGEWRACVVCAFVRILENVTLCVFSARVGRAGRAEC